MQLATLQAFVASAVVILAPVADASVLHRNLHQARRHTHLHHEHHRALESPPSSVSSVVKRGTCAFPTDDPNLVAVTPDQKNAGWALSPDQSCQPGHYCPIACKEGMVMNQWDPDSTYTYPSSMNGGLYCDDNGNVKKPFPGEPNCVPGTGTVKAINKCAKKISYCQTVLPGNEAMLIPTVVDSMSTLAVPGISYWQKTAAHFYINGPGIGSEGCIWGKDSNPLGNWAHYVAGANTDASGQTFVQLSINPVWQSSSLFSTKPGFGVKIECPDGNCNGLPCEISEEGEIKSNNLASGAGGANFCVVTVPKGSSAHIVAFDGSGGHSSAPALGNAAAAQDSSSSSSSKSSSTPPPPPSTTSTHSSTPSPTPTPTPTSTSTSSTTTSSSTRTTTSSSHTTTTTTTTTTTVSTPSSTTSEAPTVQPGIFHEENNSTATHTPNSTYVGSPSSPQATPTTKDKKNDSGRQQGSTTIVSLVFAVVAAACFF